MSYMPTGVGTAAAMYGAPASPQPASTSNGVTTETNTTTRTAPTQAQAQSIFTRPSLWLVLILAAAVLLVHYSVHGFGKRK